MISADRATTRRRRCQYGFLGVLGLALGFFVAWAVVMFFCWVLFLWPASVVYWWTLRCAFGRNLIKPDISGFGVVCGLGGWAALLLIVSAAEHGTKMLSALQPGVFWAVVAFAVGPAIYALLNQPQQATSDAESTTTP